MSKNPYEILGVSATATRAEIDEAYYNLRDKYRLDMHCEGDIGKNAAIKLNELEEAYKDVIIDYTGNSSQFYSAETNNADVSGDPIVTDSIFSDVERLIKDKNFKEAQKALDNISERNAEWHFYQSAIYYKQNWLNESRSQLQIACNMDPSNKKYSDNLNKLNQKINSANNVSQTHSVGGNEGYRRSYSDSDYDARRAEDSCCQACQCALCTNCLCNCCCRG